MKLTKKDILIEEYNKSLTKITLSDIKIEFVETIVAEKGLKKNDKFGNIPTADGMSYKEVSIGEQLKTMRDERKNAQIRLNIIKKMLK